MSAKKSKKVKNRAGPGVRRREIVAILLFSLAAFSGFALYVDTAGWVGQGLRRALRIGFGGLAPVYILVFFLISFYLFGGGKRPLAWWKILGSALFLFAVTLAFQMHYYRGNQFPPRLGEELQYAKRGEGAGVLGALCLSACYNAFGIQGSYILVGSSGLIGIIFFFGISLRELGRKLFRKISAMFTDWRSRLLERFRRRKVRALERRQRKSKPKEKPAQNGSKTSPQKTAAPLKKQERKPEPQEGKQEKPAAVAAQKEPASGGFQLPPLYLLQKSKGRTRRTEGEQRELLVETFANFGIEAKVVNVSQGPVVTRYELQPAPGIKVSRITALADDLALAFAAEDVRIEAPVPGKPVVGIEVPNRHVEPVLLRDVLESREFAEHSSPLALALGKDIGGEPVIADLKSWLHLLIAGATGSGKSVCLKSLIASILFRTDPELVKLLMIDPKRVELSVFDGIPHLLAPVVIDPRKAAQALRWAVVEMERRYQLFADCGVRNLDAYLAFQPEGEKENLPYIVIIIDELADLMMVAAAEVEDAICRLAQMARAAGIYLIIATQRPSVDVITGLIKANVPSRISFAVSSQVDSRTILDMGGAERLIGRGDMLYYPMGAAKPTRAQGAWISDKEVDTLVKFWKKQGEPSYDHSIEKTAAEASVSDEYEDDELLPDAIRLVVENGQASISMLQRRFRIGYSRAARLIDVMEVRGIVGSHQGSKPREVLADTTILEER